MKKYSILLYVLTVFFANFNLNAHSEWVHQYIVNEAYKYLERELSNASTYSPINDAELYDYFGEDYFYGKTPENHWSKYYHNNQTPNNSIMRGAWVEDNYDIVFGYNNKVDWITPSVSHFWDSDDGDDTRYTIKYGIKWFKNFHNNFTKAKRLVFGKDYYDKFYIKYNIKRYLGKGYWATNIDVSHISYYNLFDLIMQNKHFLKEYVQENFFSSNIKLPVYQWEIPKNKSIPYNIIGRVCHLLLDNAVPAHTKVRFHPCILSDGDLYEMSMASIAADCDPSPAPDYYPAKLWNATTAREQGGLLYEIFNLPDEEALHYLFYTTNQVAQQFASYKPPSTMKIPGNRNLISAYNDPIIPALFNQTGQIGFNDYYQDKASDILLNYAIRATATFLYWIAVRTGQLPCPTELQLQNNIYYGNRNNNITQFCAVDRIVCGNNVRNDLPLGIVKNAIGSRSEYIAGKEIVLKDGFISENGSSVAFYIDENPCKVFKEKSTTNSSFQTSIAHNSPITNTDSVKVVNIYLPLNTTIMSDSLKIESATWTRFNFIPKRDTSLYPYPDSIYSYEDEYIIADTVKIFYSKAIDSLYSYTPYQCDTIIDMDSIAYYDSLRLNNTYTWSDSIIITSTDKRHVYFDADGSFKIFRYPLYYSKNPDHIIANKSDITVLITPNPATNKFNLNCNLPEDGLVSIFLVDNAGKQVKKFINEQYFTKGTHLFEFNTSELQSGVYNCILSYKDRFVSEQIIIAK